ncbi:MAG: tetratricopeptide repeat protein [bacterium]
MNNQELEQLKILISEVANDKAAGNFDGAIEKYKTAIQLNPNNPGFYHELGILYANKREFSLAVQAYSNSLKINPKSFTTLNNLGNVYDAINENKLAGECFKKALELNPSYTSAIANLINNYSKTKNYEEAKELCNSIYGRLSSYIELIKIDQHINDTDFRYKISTHNKKVHNYDSIMNIDTKIAVVYFYENDFNEDDYNLFLKYLDSQTYKNYSCFIANKDLSALLAEIIENKCSYVCFVEQKDILVDRALAEIVKEVSLNNNLEFIYTDEDILTQTGNYIEPYFKTAYAEFILHSHNYMNALLCLKLNEKILPYFNQITKLNQNSLYELVFNLCGNDILPTRISEVLYHRHYENAQKLKHNNTSKIVEKEFKRRSYDATVIGSTNGSNIAKFNNNGIPKVSIIIPFKDKIYLLKDCINSIEKKSTYANYEIILVDNRSSEQETFDYLDTLNYTKIKADFEFNYSKINNIATEIATGDYYIFLNNDIEVIEPNWIEHLLSLAQLDKVGIVGAKLLYTNGQVQHSGMIKYGNRRISHCNRFISANAGGYHNYNNIIREYLCVTGACVMIAKKKFEEIGGFDENLQVELNDVDLCYKLADVGYINLYNPHCLLYHHESISRAGLFKDQVKGEFVYFHQKWEKIVSKEDPYYNENLSDFRVDFAVKIF